MPSPTFSLRQLLKSTVLSPSSKVPGQQNLTKFQSFSLHNTKTIEAVTSLASELEHDTENEPQFCCSKCGKTFQTWLEVARHSISENGSFAKHLTKSLDQALVIFSTEAQATSLTSVLKCRKCKFYLPSHSDKQIEQVLKHVQACGQKAEPDAHALATSECALCAGRHAGHPAAGSVCAETLKSSLALQCRPKAVTKCDNLAKLGKCLAVISHTFAQDNGDSIEELIVASKQRSKAKHFH